MIRKLAYWIVYSDLKKCELFMGKYDAIHGSTEFMNGIWCVMEYIAHSISENCHFDFDTTFINNLIASKNKAGRNNNDESEN